MEKNIEIIARGIAVRDGKILLCKVKTKENWFFPGGHVEFGEGAEEALRREFQEEIRVDLESINFVGINENRFAFEGEKHQELNIIFEVSLKNIDFKCREDHLEFGWFSFDQVKKRLVLPEGMKKAVLGWLNDEKNFYCHQ